MNNIQQRKQQGFTLIELVIVIVILGILAATASPKFLNLQSDARASTVEGLSASLKSAANIVYSKALVQGVANTDTGATTNPALSVVYGYPEATIAAMASILEITSRAASTTDPDTTTTEDWEIAADSTSNQVRLYPEGSYDGTSAAFTNDLACYVEYTEATATTVAVVEIQTSGC